MNIYLIVRDDEGGYDSYDSAVVCAENEEEARKIHPGGGGQDTQETAEMFDTWCNLTEVSVKYIGEAKEVSVKGIICTSFNAG